MKKSSKKLIRKKMIETILTHLLILLKHYLIVSAFVVVDKKLSGPELVGIHDTEKHLPHTGDG